MSLSICASEAMVSGPAGTGFAGGWMPRIVTERFITSTRDGDVQRAPDPVPFIEGEITWTNTGAAQHVWLYTHRAPRVVISTNPNMYTLDDALSWDVAVSPNAPAPWGSQDGVGARMQVTPPAQAQILAAREYRGWDDSIRVDEIGTVLEGETVHVRYAANYTTPGSWRVPAAAGAVVRAFWVRLKLFSAPEVTP
ncbi:DUF7172 family protein [Nocardia carnea]|uniref:DUF7172 family protein n=1 Tax=Nocardia carnea TaxID=37328 RepID=UPI002458678F|nr:hypothetical protein [Nocardia carnea]